jgi:hypothetical protein
MAEQVDLIARVAVLETAGKYLCEKVTKLEQSNDRQEESLAEIRELLAQRAGSDRVIALAWDGVKLLMGGLAGFFAQHWFGSGSH